MASQPKIGCFSTLGLLILMSFLVTMAQQVWFWIIALALGAVAFWLVMQNKKRKQAELTQELLTMAAFLEVQANLLESDRELVGNAELALQKNEKVLFEISQVSLLEYKSTGSSYQGGNLGVGFRVADGVSIGVGGSKGQLIRNPATKQITDAGTATFTNQRAVFVGEQRTVEWDYDKLAGMDAGPNGLTVQIAVSNRPSNTGLAVVNHGDITPGIALDIATTFAREGKLVAIEKCREYAVQLRASVRRAS